MAEKKSFVMAYDHQALFQQLTDEQAGKLIKAIYAYELKGEITTFTDPLLIAFFTGVLKPFIDANKEKYEKKCKKNAENVAKRWNKNIPDNTKNTDVYDGIQTNTNVCDGMKNAENSSKNDSKSDTNVYEHIPPYTKNTKNTEYEYDYEYEYDSKEGIVNNIHNACAREETYLPTKQPVIEHMDAIAFYQENIDPLMSSYVSECIKDDCEQYGEENVLAAMQQAKLANKRNYKYIRATAKGKYNDAVYGPSEAYVARQKESAPPKRFSEETCLSGMTELLASKGYKVNG